MGFGFKGSRAEGLGPFRAKGICTGFIMHFRVSSCTKTFQGLASLAFRI